jgi:hypothetical protein
VKLEHELSGQAIEVWWEYIIIAAVLIFGVYCFLVLVGFRTRLLSSRTNRTAESMYSSYAGSTRKQRKYAREHGGLRRDDEDSKSP